MYFSDAAGKLDVSMTTFIIPSTGVIQTGTRPAPALPWPGGPGRAVQAPIDPAEAPRGVGGRPAPRRDTHDPAAAPHDQGPQRPRRSLPALLPHLEPAPSPGASSGFLAQFLAQAGAEAGNAQPRHQGVSAQGSEAYRRAGGQPPLYSEEPIFIRLDV